MIIFSEALTVKSTTTCLISDKAWAFSALICCWAFSSISACLAWPSFSNFIFNFSPASLADNIISCASFLALLRTSSLSLATFSACSLAILAAFRASLICCSLLFKASINGPQACHLNIKRTTINVDIVHNNNPRSMVNHLSSQPPPAALSELMQETKIKHLILFIILSYNSKYANN